MRKSLTGKERRTLLSDVRASNELSYVYRRSLYSYLSRAGVSDDEISDLNDLLRAVIAAQVRLNATINELCEEVERQAVVTLLPKELVPLNDPDRDPHADELRKWLRDLADSLADRRSQMLSED